MKTSRSFRRPLTALPARCAARSILFASLVLLLGFSFGITLCRAQQPDNDVQGAQVLTRGPVHEAFAGTITFNPEPGVVVTKAPPEVIEELPPEQKPEGDNVTWIPGYWAWDDERSDFLWVSGTWRALPPGRAWMAGYWAQTSRGHQWTSGYWADAAVQETTYLPPPPATVEVGPNIAAPSVDYGWTPGCWIWYSGRYAWRPGYWAQGRADWDWSPAHYVWTPHGHIFVGGYWDYPVERRGILFAPVYFDVGVYSRSGYYYSPSIVINLDLFNDHLFLRPSYCHYYFGDYYAPSYYQGGFYASFSFQSGRYGYDPFYAHERWENRHDRDWEHHVETSYQYRRDHEAARPPRTWAAQRDLSPTTRESQQNRVLVAAPLTQLAARTDSPLRLQPVAREERQQLARRGQEVQRSREQRRTLEATAVASTSRRAGAIAEPVKVQLPRSSIVARPADQLGKNQAPPPEQRAPIPDPKFKTKSENANRAPGVERGNPQVQSRPPGVERGNPQVQSRQPELDRQPRPARGESPPREKPVQPEAERRVKESKPQAQGESQRNAVAAERQAQEESQQRANTSAAKAREESQRNASRPERQTPRVPEPSARYKAVPDEKGGGQLLRNDARERNRSSEATPERPGVPRGQ